MRRFIIALLVFGAAFCLSAFLAAAGRAGALWPTQAGHPLSLLLAGAAVLSFLLAATGLVWRIVPITWWRALVVTAAGLSLALGISCFAPWIVSLIVVDTVLLWGVLAKGWSADVDPMTLSPDVPAGIPALIRVPVPWVFVLAYGVGVGIQFAVPFPVHSASLLLPIHIAGFAAMLSGVALAAWCLGLFRAARTTTVPLETSQELVVSGPYRLSRNPMYVSLTLMYLGEAGIMAQVWPLLPLPLVLLYLNRIVIPAEEARLREAFGDAYERLARESVGGYKGHRRGALP